ncbi:prion-like-(Q N-rich) domain-bearing 25 [Brachionus plicatilis]|uniref:Prion-like-(Q N-rich) domain-bearing 25 n=1 Tax=Brachionus plicatilis TaxID=10195 RepID=A0A3M7PW24_BRAPC|nr:prion-like-(Q N-rich) domain-bearing 25 [Brachionus plicatilis]
MIVLILKFDLILQFAFINTLEYWDSSECRPKKIHLEDCTENNECLDSELTVCAGDGKCRCREGNYLSKDVKSCVRQLGEFEKCEQSEMCLGEMTCSSYHECTCGQDEYFKNTTNECVTKKSLNGYCDRHNECSDQKNLICLNNECSCPNLTYTWDTNDKKCKFTYTIECVENDECDESKGLRCTDYLQRCNCPSNQSGKICDCKKNDQYWNGLECVNRKSFSSSCTSSSECRNELICLDNMCRCQFFERRDGNECNRRCPEVAVFYGGKCYFFSEVTRAANQARGYCENLNVGSEDWELAEIRNGMQSEFTSYLRHNSITDAFWIMDDDDDRIKNFRIDSFNTDISSSTQLKVICVEDD